MRVYHSNNKDNERTKPELSPFSIHDLTYERRTFTCSSLLEMINNKCPRHTKKKTVQNMLFLFVPENRRDISLPHDILCTTKILPVRKRNYADTTQITQFLKQQSPVFPKNNRYSCTRVYIFIYVYIYIIHNILVTCLVHTSWSTSQDGERKVKVQPPRGVTKVTAKRVKKQFSFSPFFLTLNIPVHRMTRKKKPAREGRDEGK